MRIGSLFSGIGGLELGLEWAGVGHTVFQVEREEFCRAVLARHWPSAVRFDDVCAVGAHNLPPVDLICGGFPCQDLSYAGKGAGIDGARSGLWREYARIIGEVRPRFVVVENVAALLGRGVDRVLGDLAALGFDAVWIDLRAADVGAPHRRERLFIVGFRPVADAEHVRFRGHEGGRDAGGMATAARAVSGSGSPQAVHIVGSGEVWNIGATDQSMADGDRSGLDWRSQSDGEPEAGREVLDRRHLDGRGVAGGRLGRLAQPVMGRVPDGLPAGLDRWPARPGEAQHEWEAPRVAQGVANRAARLKALGNAVVPQVAYIVGRVVLEIAASEAA